MKNIFILVLCVLFITFIFRIFNYSLLDRMPFSWDQAMHMVLASQYSVLLKTHHFKDFATVYRFYPPLTYLLFMPFLEIFGTTKIAAASFNITFISLVLIGIYYLIKKNLGARTAVLTCLLLAATLLFNSVIKIWEFMIEIPLACILLLFFTYFRFLFKKNTINIIEAFLLAVLVGAVGLIKGTGFIYLLLPSVYAFYKLLKKSPINALSFLTIAVAFNYWYFFNFKAELDEAYFRNVFTGIYVKSNVQGLASFLFYLQSFYWILGPLVLPLVLSFILFCKSKSRIRLVNADIVMLASLILAFISISLNPNKDGRYLHSGILLALLFAGWFIGSKTSKLTYATVFIFILGIFLAKIFLSFPVPSEKLFLLNELPKIIAPYKENKIYYFFEDDSPFFNYANLDLLRENGAFSELNLINRNSIDAFPETEGECQIEKGAVIVAYSYSVYEKTYPEHHVSISQYCKRNSIDDTCKLFQLIKNEANSEQINILKCNDI